MNNIEAGYLYSVSSNETSDLQNSPFSYNSFVAVCFGSSLRGIIIAALYDGSQIKMRIGWDSWRNWVTIK